MLEIKQNKFYILIKKGKENKSLIFTEEKPAITKVKEYLKEGENAKNIQLLEVEIKEEKFEITTIPWSYIAMQIVKSD